MSESLATYKAQYKVSLLLNGGGGLGLFGVFFKKGDNKNKPNKNEIHFSE